jgi:hypothetical protein
MVSPPPLLAVLAGGAGVALTVLGGGAGVVLTAPAGGAGVVRTVAEDGAPAAPVPAVDAHPPRTPATAMAVTAVAKCREFIRITVRGGHWRTRPRAASLT